MAMYSRNPPLAVGMASKNIVYQSVHYYLYFNA